MRVIVIFLCEQNGLNGHRLFFLVNHFVCARHETEKKKMIGFRISVFLRHAWFRLM